MNIQTISILLATLFTMVFFQNCGDSNEFSNDIESAKLSSEVDAPVQMQTKELQAISHIKAVNCKRKKAGDLDPNALIYTVTNNDDYFPESSSVINMDIKTTRGASYYSAKHVLQVDTFIVTKGQSQEGLNKDLAQFEQNIEESISHLCSIQATHYMVNSEDNLDLTTKLSEEELSELESEDVIIANN